MKWQYGTLSPGCLEWFRVANIPNVPLPLMNRSLRRRFCHISGWQVCLTIVLWHVFLLTTLFFLRNIAPRFSCCSVRTYNGTLASLRWKFRFFDILFFALWSTPCSISVDQTDYINKTSVDALFPTDPLFEQTLANAPPLSIDESRNRWETWQYCLSLAATVASTILVGFGRILIVSYKDGDSAWVR